MRYTIECTDPRADVDLACSAFHRFSPYIQRFYPAASEWFEVTALPQFMAWRRRIWVALHNSEPVGIVISKSDLVHREKAKICTLFVDPRARGHGIGTGLLAAVVAWHDDNVFSSLTIRCPVRVQGELQPLLLAKGFIPLADPRTIPLSLEPEVSFYRFHPSPGKTQLAGSVAVVNGTPL